MLKIHYKNKFNKEIIIFGNENIIFLKKLFKKNFSYYCWNTNNFIILFNYKFFLNLFLSIVNYKILKNPYKINILNLIYLKSFVLTINPKIIITYCDDSILYSTLCINFKTIRFLAIQNGNRSIWQLKRNKYFHDLYFAHGKFLKNIFKKFKTKISHYYSIGSMIPNYYFKRISNNQKLFDICLVSPIGYIYGADNKEDYSSEATKNSVLILDKYLSNLVKEHKLKLCIAISKQNYFRSLQYYKDIYGDNVKIVISKNFLSIYNTLYSSELTVSLNSTCIFESWGLNKKAIFVDFTKTNNWNYIKNPLLVHRKNIYKDFEKKIIGILSMSNKLYKNKVLSLTRKYAEDLSTPKFIFFIEYLYSLIYQKKHERS